MLKLKSKLKKEDTDQEMNEDIFAKSIQVFDDRSLTSVMRCKRQWTKNNTDFKRTLHG